MGTVEQLHVSYGDPARFKAYERNARTHSTQQIKELEAAITEFGFTNPLLVDEEDVIIAGHARLVAAVSKGIEAVPYIVLGGLTTKQKNALRIADNKLALNSAWDYGLVVAELQTLDEYKDLTGFTTTELRALLRIEDTDEFGANPPDAGDEEGGVHEFSGDPEEEDVTNAGDPLAGPIVTRTGDCWQLGAHRILCGDNADPHNVARLMAGKAVALLFTSPPYLQQRDYGKGRVGWDTLMERAFEAISNAMAGDGQILVNLGLVHDKGEWLDYWHNWVEGMRTAGWRRFGLYVWDQGPGMQGNWSGRLAPAFELIFHFNREARTLNKTVKSKHGGTLARGTGLRRPDGQMSGVSHFGRPSSEFKIPDAVVRVMRQKGGVGHPAPFPIALPEFLIDTFTNEGEACLDPFGGSGTALLAAQRTGRIGHCLELEPRWVDVAVRRFRTAFPAEPVTLADDGRPFDELAVERLSQAAA